MTDWTERLSTIGGGLGGITAYILNVQLFHIIEVTMYAFIGSTIGEAVKELVVYIKKRKKQKYGR